MKTFDLTPKQAYELVLAALNLVGGVSPNVVARCRRDVKKGLVLSDPKVHARDLVDLIDALNALRPPDFADAVIRQNAENRT